MSASEIVNKVWNYAHVLCALRSLSGFIKYFLNSVLVTQQKSFGLYQLYPEHRYGHDGVGYGNYVEQITYLIFLKMADERDKAGQKVIEKWFLKSIRDVEVVNICGPYV